MTNQHITMPEPVARASVLMYLDRRQFLLAELGTEAAGELTWGEHNLITTNQAEAYADARVRELASGLQHLADRAYCGYIDTLKSTQCLGWENKVKSGKFGTAELNAHKEAAQLLGRHRAFSESVKAILALIK